MQQHLPETEEAESSNVKYLLLIFLHQADDFDLKNFGMVIKYIYKKSE